MSHSTDDAPENLASFSQGRADALPTAAALQAQEVVHLVRVTSTMDEAHARAERSAPAGTLIVADEQTAGRGRSGNVWESQRGRGVWFTLIERPPDAAAVDVLSIRVGLAIARSVEAIATGPVRLKWPNDVYVDGGKLAGILIEARWRAGVVDWVAIGVGLNLRAPEENAGAATLKAGTTRNMVLTRVVPAVREAAGRRGILSAQEQSEWLQRDLSLNRRITAPVAGVVRGIAPNGAVRVEDHTGVVHELRAGSLMFA